MHTEYKNAVPEFTVRLVGVAPCKWHIEFYKGEIGNVSGIASGIAADREQAEECLRCIIGLKFPSYPSGWKE